MHARKSIVAQDWLDYAADRRPGPLRDRLIEANLQLVRFFASKLAAKHPLAEFDDLFAIGTLGLIDAVERFDPHRGVHFVTFAGPYIRGAMLDDYNQAAWGKRKARQQLNRLAIFAEALEQRLGRRPTDDELAAEVGMTSESLEALRRDGDPTRFASLSWPLESGDTIEDVLADPKAESPDARLDRADTFHALTAGLTHRERLIVHRIHYADDTLEPIAAEFGISVSRVHQIHRAALDWLRSELSRERGVAS